MSFAGKSRLSALSFFSAPDSSGRSTWRLHVRCACPWPLDARPPFSCRLVRCEAMPCRSSPMLPQRSRTRKHRGTTPSSRQDRAAKGRRGQDAPFGMARPCRRSPTSPRNVPVLVAPTLGVRHDGWQHRGKPAVLRPTPEPTSAYWSPLPDPDPLAEQDWRRSPMNERLHHRY